MSATQKSLVVAGMVLCAILSAIVFIHVGSQMAAGWDRQLATGAGESPTQAGWVALLSSILGMLGFGWAAKWVLVLDKYAGPVINKLPINVQLPVKDVDADPRQDTGPQMEQVMDTSDISMFLTLSKKIKDPKAKAELVKAARTACDLWRDAQFPEEAVK